jgi:hypothetical protein
VTGEIRVALASAVAADMSVTGNHRAVAGLKVGAYTLSLVYSTVKVAVPVTSAASVI